jgi:hypothetical protein
MEQPAGSERNEPAANLEDDDYERMQEERRAYNRLSSARSRLRTKEKIADLVALSEKQAQQISQLEQVNLQLVEQLRVFTAEHQRLQQILREERRKHHQARQQAQQQPQNINLQLLINSLTKKAIAERILQTQVAAIRRGSDGRQVLPASVTIPAEKRNSYPWVANDTSSGTTAAAPIAPSGVLLRDDSILQTYNDFLASLSRK